MLQLYIVIALWWNGTTAKMEVQLLERKNFPKLDLFIIALYFGLVEIGPVCIRKIVPFLKMFINNYR